MRVNRRSSNSKAVFAGGRICTIRLVVRPHLTIKPYQAGNQVQCKRKDILRGCHSYVWDLYHAPRCPATRQRAKPYPAAAARWPSLEVSSAAPTPLCHVIHVTLAPCPHLLPSRLQHSFLWPGECDSVAMMVGASRRTPSVSRSQPATSRNTFNKSILYSVCRKSSYYVLYLT
jgi:hypothetical protein